MWTMNKNTQKSYLEQSFLLVEFFCLLIFLTIIRGTWGTSSISHLPCVPFSHEINSWSSLLLFWFFCGILYYVWFYFICSLSCFSFFFSLFPPQNHLHLCSISCLVSPSQWCSRTTNLTHKPRHFFFAFNINFLYARPSTDIQLQPESTELSKKKTPTRFSLDASIGRITWDSSPPNKDEIHLIHTIIFRSNWKMGSRK